MADNDAGHAWQAEQLGRFKADSAVDKIIVVVDQNRDAEAQMRHGRGRLANVSGIQITHVTLGKNDLGRRAIDELQLGEQVVANDARLGARDAQAGKLIVDTRGVLRSFDKGDGRIVSA